MKAENIRYKKEMLVKQYNTLKEKIDEGKTAIANMNCVMIF